MKISGNPSFVAGYREGHADGFKEGLEAVEALLKKVIAEHEKHPSDIHHIGYAIHAGAIALAVQSLKPSHPLGDTKP